MTTATPNVITLRYEPRPYFVDFHARAARFVVAVCHRRAGKTEACIAELIERALRNPFEDSMYAYIAPYMGQAKRTAWKRLKKLCGPKLIAVSKVSETASTITFPNNATIFILGSDNIDAIRGSGWDGIVLDEVADMPDHVWGQVIRPALMDRLGWAVFIGTPKGKNNLFYRQRKRAVENKTGEWLYMELRASQNKYLNSSELASLIAELDEEDIAQEMECSFEAAARGSFYGKTIDKMEDEGRLEAFSHVKAAPVHIAFDIGISDDTACWFFQVVNGELSIVDHFSESGLSMQGVVDLIEEMSKERGYKRGDWWLPHDAAAREWQSGKTSLEQLYAMGFSVRRVPSESVQDGIQAVRYTLPKVRINGDRCDQGIEALKAYSKRYNEKSKAYSREPLHDWSSHSADAMRYLCLAVRDHDIKLSETKRSTRAPLGDDVSVISGLPSLNTGDDYDVSAVGIDPKELEYLDSLMHPDAYERI